MTARLERAGERSAPQEAEETATAPPIVSRRERYASVLQAHGKGLARVVGSYASGPTEQEDLVQELALALWQALPRFRGEASLKTFAYRVATNLAITHVRRRRAHAPLHEAPDDSPSPENVAERSHQRRRLRQAIAALPLSLRQVVALRLEELSYAEIGDVLGISETNVSVRLTRARKQLRERLGEQP